MSAPFPHHPVTSTSTTITVLQVRSFHPKESHGQLLVSLPPISLLWYISILCPWLFSKTHVRALHPPPEINVNGSLIFIKSAFLNSAVILSSLNWQSQPYFYYISPFKHLTQLLVLVHIILWNARYILNLLFLLLLTASDCKTLPLHEYLTKSYSSLREAISSPRSCN